MTAALLLVTLYLLFFGNPLQAFDLRSANQGGFARTLLKPYMLESRSFKACTDKVNFKICAQCTLHQRKGYLETC